MIQAVVCPEATVAAECQKWDAAKELAGEHFFLLLFFNLSKR
jgi:hypothetical protein